MRLINKSKQKYMFLLNILQIRKKNLKELIELVDDREMSFANPNNQNVYKR